MQFLSKTSIDFVGKRQLFLMVTIGLTIVSLLSLIISPPKFGIDFTGGNEIAVAFEKDVKADEIRDAVSAIGITGAEIKSFGGSNQFLIRIPVSETGNDKIKTELVNKITNNPMTVLKVDKVGPKVGNEMRTQALIAVLLASIAILLYLAFRFEFRFGVAAIIALVHDVVLSFSILVLLNNIGLFHLEVDTTILAGILTVIGYSINDTVIIFDRVRENLELHKGMSLPNLVNLSINETLSRTINTVTTTLLTLIVIAAIGGPVLFGFALTMILGIIFGTYSSVYVASSFLIWYSERNPNSTNTKVKVAKA